MHYLFYHTETFIHFTSHALFLLNFTFLDCANCHPHGTQTTIVYICTNTANTIIYIKSYKNLRLI